MVRKKVSSLRSFSFAPLQSSYAPSSWESNPIQTPEVTIERHEPSGVSSSARWWHPPCSMSKPVEGNLRDEHGMKSEIEHTDGPMSSRSNSRSWWSSDDEIVDLTKPRLESFVQANMASSQFHVNTSRIELELAWPTPNEV